MDWLGEDAGSTASPQTSCAHQQPPATRQPTQMSTNAQIVHTTASNQELATPKQGGFTPEWNIRPSYHPNLCPKRNVPSLVFFLRITPLSHGRCCINQILVYCRLVQTYKCLNLFLKDSARWVNTSCLSGRTIVFSCL